MHAVLVPVYLLLVTPITLSWWATTGQTVPNDPLKRCDPQRRLKGKLADICSKKRELLLRQISLGVALGHRECQYQFRYRHWNCTTLGRSMKKVLLRDTRETGFVNAMRAAGITFQVTRACTTGELTGCSCDRKFRNHNKKGKKNRMRGSAPEGNWEWEGCGGENVDFGIKKSKDYLDTRHRRRSDMKTLVTLHNYMAGRLAIKNYMRTDCKCHGLSGSCTLKTCWRKMPPFREVGNRLKERFDGASKVITGNDGHSFWPDGPTIKPPGKVDLVYSEESPSFCLPNNTLGSFGVQGRTCEANSQGEEGCDILCCHRNFSTRSVTEEKTCKCKFEWCCEVNCEKCQVNRTISTC